ncbi:MAG TPA: glutaminyl-peptide cyclotransferase [Pseudomonadales bacterium]|nr:glutaminyl-peptide cyclotransferase [Pseudomonadales bacterium]
MHKSARIVCLFLCLLAAVTHAETPVLPWQLLRSIPRLPNHFTQGLVYADGQLFESTGHYGQSRLISYDAKTMALQKQQFLRADVFGEGLTFLNKKLYQASWKSHELFVYDTALQPLQTLAISGDSWGLTTDGHSLIMSNGSDTLQFLDPDTGKTLRSITVTDNSGNHWQDINELEWIDGHILANVWHRNTVLVIDGITGHITSQYDLEKLSQDVSRHMPSRDSEQVLNGMAWNPETHTLLVTGKDWPLWFELKITLH